MFDQKIKARAEELGKWLTKEYPEIRIEQAHLDDGTPERGYSIATCSAAASS